MAQWRRRDLGKVKEGSKPRKERWTRRHRQQDERRQRNRPERRRPRLLLTPPIRWLRLCRTGVQQPLQLRRKNVAGFNCPLAGQKESLMWTERTRRQVPAEGSPEREDHRSRARRSRQSKACSRGTLPEEGKTGRVARHQEKKRQRRTATECLILKLLQ